MEKGIKLVAWGGDYNNSSLEISKSEEGILRKEFTKQFFEFYKKHDWMLDNMKPKEVLTFIDELNNDEIGEELYNNLKENFYFLQDILNKSFDVKLNKEYYEIVYTNKGEDDYFDESSYELISLFKEKYITPYLNNHEEFKKWFLEKLENANKELYLLLLDNEISKARLISLLELELEQEKGYKKNSEKNIIKYNEEIKEIENKLKSIKENK